MKQPTTLAIILAGGEGKRMGALTKARAKPALPIAGVYRLIDVPLSHCVHSHIRDVWVIEQFEPHSLNDHLTNGRPWDLDRTYGGLRLLPPYTGSEQGGWHQGNADALYRNRHLIREHNPDLILVLSADHIYQLDLRDVIAAHIERQADVTLVTTEVAQDEASRFGVVETDDEGRVTHFEYKPDQPRSTTVTTEVFVYTADLLLETPDELAQRDDAIKDWGDQLLPMLVERGNVWSFALPGYWRDVGTIVSYWQAHMDLLQEEPPITPDDPAWPLRTTGEQRMPARIYSSARIDQSLIAPGCDVRGHVRRSVIGPGVTIAEDAVIEDAVVLHRAVIERGARISTAIIDQDARIGAGAIIGASAGARPDDDQIVVIGAGIQVAAGATIAPGSRLDPSLREAAKT